MKQILNTNSGIKVHTLPMPTCGDKELLICVESSVISTGTETMDMRHKSMEEVIKEKMALLEKVQKAVAKDGLFNTIESIIEYLNPKERALLFAPVGYSNSGVVKAKGLLVEGFNVGERVACAGSGIAAHAEYVTVPVNLVAKIPDNVSHNEAAFTTIGSIALQGLRRSNVSFGETVVITGLGLIGLLAVQIAKAWGLVVIGLDINESRLDLAKHFGADYCFKANDVNIEKNIHELTGGHGVDAVIIYAATSSSEPANQAMRISRRKGRVVVVGSIGMDLKRDGMYEKELDFVMSTSYGPGRYDKSYEVKGVDYPIGYVRWTENRNMIEFIRLLSIKKIDVEPLISNIFKIEEAEAAYKSLVENPGKNISSLFVYPKSEDAKLISKLEMYPRNIPTGKIRVGIIGAGGFVQTNHLPNILKLSDSYDLVAIASGKPFSAKSLGEKYSTTYITTDYNELLKDPNIDLVVIGTRHNLHAVQVADAIKAGKHVLVEKPLAMNASELEMVENAYRLNPSVCATVGFNRRYSPLVQKVKQIISKSETPIVINYRLNAGYFAPEIWVQDLEEGGGRIVGEVCHFIDLITYLAGCQPNSIQVASVPVNGKNIRSEDNIVVTFSFENGSIGVITYVSIGGKSMEKERIEVFADGKSMVIVDFKELQMYDTGEPNVVLKEVDKGHYKEIEEFAKLIKGEPSLILPFEVDLKITQYTNLVLESIHGKRSIAEQVEVK